MESHRKEDLHDMLAKSIAKSNISREKVDLPKVYMDILPVHETNALLNQYGYLVEKFENIIVG